jgi:hypothetical protein
VPEAEADSVEEPEKGDEKTDNKAQNGSEATEDTDNK